MPEASQHPPRAATELFPEALTLSPKQSLVLNTLREFPHGASATELAKRLGMHANTVRGHLEELLAHQAVSQHSAPAQGRGRPTLIFQARVPDTRAVAQEYISLIGHLAQAIEPDQAREIGRRWAQSEGSGSVEDLVENSRASALIPSSGRRIRPLTCGPAPLCGNPLPRTPRCAACTRGSSRSSSARPKTPACSPCAPTAPAPSCWRARDAPRRC